MILDLNGNRVVEPGVLVGGGGSILKIGELKECEEYGLELASKLKPACTGNCGKQEFILGILANTRLYKLPDSSEVYDKVMNCEDYVFSDEFELNNEIKLIKNFV